MMPRFAGILFTAGCILAAAVPALAQYEDGSLMPLDVGAEADTLAVADTADTVQPPPDTTSFAQADTGPKKLKIIRRAYNYREQLGLALGMMAFVLVIFTTAQNWNPE